MERVLGVGGVFFRARDKAALGAWYRDNLGVPVHEAWGGAVFTIPPDAFSDDEVQLTWSPFTEDSTYWPAGKQFMLNYVVRDVRAMLAQLAAAGAEVDERVEESEYGTFGWFTDPEGNRGELWCPPATAPGA